MSDDVAFRALLILIVLYTKVQYYYASINEII